MYEFDVIESKALLPSINDKYNFEILNKKSLNNKQENPYNIAKLY